MDFFLDSRDIQLTRYLIKESGIIYEDDISVEDAITGTRDLFSDGITWGRVLTFLVMTNNMHKRNKHIFLPYAARFYFNRIQPWITRKGGFVNCKIYMEGNGSKKILIIIIFTCTILATIYHLMNKTSLM